jgi:competence protein ComEA
MRLASLLNTKAVLVLTLLAGATVSAQSLPDGPGKAEMMSTCSSCHALDQALSATRDRKGWTQIIVDMIDKGLSASDQDLQTILDYLVKNYGYGEPATSAKVHVNKAAVTDLESVISLTPAEATAIIDYRGKNGPFKSIDDLKKVSGIDPAKLDAKKDLLAFD